MKHRTTILGVCLVLAALLALIPGSVMAQERSPTIVLFDPAGQTIFADTTTTVRDDPLLAGLPEQPWFYFVHSYCAPVGASTLASCLHGESFAAIVRQGNFFGAQFHPERSARSGARLLANFLELQ